MSLKKFSKLFLDLDSSNSTNNKIEVLKNYFLSNDPIDNSWAIYLLTGKSNKRFISGRSLKNLFSQIYVCLLYTSPSPRDRQKSRMPSSA